MRTEEPKKIFLKDYQPPAFLIDRVELCFSLHPSETIVTSVLAVRRNPEAPKNNKLILDGEGLELLELQLNNVALSTNLYELSETCLEIEAPEDEFSLRIKTRISPEDNKRLEGLYRSGGLYCTQCEAEGFRRITYYLDRPDVLSVFTTRIEADKGEAPILLSNGNEIDKGSLDNGKHFAVWHDPHPKPAYLFALAAGRLNVVEDVFTTSSGRDVRLRIFVDPGNETQVGYAMDALKRSMAWDEENFGREYDLDDFMIVAVRSFNMGAMENKGLNIFNSSLLLATPETATDDDYARIESIIAHEYFHNWTGNRITCRDWFQLCLKEGLTVFRDQLFSADMQGAPVQRIIDVLRLRTRQFPEDDGPLAHPPRPDSFIEIDNFYTSTVYEKGAEICRMLHTVLGADAFRSGMDCYFDRHDGQAVTVEDFVAALSDGSGIDVTRFMEWYRRAGRPIVEAKSDYDNTTKLFRLIFSQVSPNGTLTSDPLPIPMRFGLLGSNGADLCPQLPSEVRQDAFGLLTLLTDAQTEIAFPLEEKPAALSLLRNFSAPVTLKQAPSESEDLFLFSFDSDPFNKWQAGQRALSRHMMSENNDVEEVKAAIERTLNAQDLEPAMKNQALALPSVSDLAQSQLAKSPKEAVNYLGLWQAREKLRRELALGLAASWQEEYAKLAKQVTDSVDAQSAGIRAMANRCLGYLSVGLDSASDVVGAAYDDAATMAERLCALTLAVHNGHDCADRLLSDFYQRFERNPIVLDKWFQVQATSPRANALETVQSLMKHAAYDKTNPNRMRSVVMAYAMGNLARFHADAPMSYDLIATEVLDLDKHNPQIAARVLSCLEAWPQLPETNQIAAKKALQRVADQDGLSSNVFEIAKKCLAHS